MAKSPRWASLSDEKLLQKRIGDLGVHLEKTVVEKSVNDLYKELSAKQILFHPPCYLADEWFVPTGDTVIGIPFYLAHPRLRKLEKEMMLEIEGESHEERMRYIRHEAGHAIYNAYQLQKKKKIRYLFGPPSDETPETYQPKLYSRNYVRNLENHYAQCDPDEDFAETFAVWLNPNRNWGKRYKGWNALKKLEYMNHLMGQIANSPPLKTTTDQPYQTSHSKSKLATYYQKKRKLYEEDFPDFFDVDLQKIFSTLSENSSQELAHRYLKRHQKLVVDKVFRWTGTKKYTVNRLFRSLMERCRETSLRLQKEEKETDLDLCSYLTSMISNYHFTGKFRRSR